MGLYANCQPYYVFQRRGAGDLITVPCSAHWRKLETSLAKPEAVVWQIAQIINTQELQGRDLAL